MKRLFFCLLATLLLSGCATSFYRFSPRNERGRNYDELSTYQYARVYPSTYMTILSLGECVSPKSGMVYNGHYYISGLQLPFHLVDFPFSLVFDTLCLPYDAIWNDDRGVHMYAHWYYRWWLTHVDSFIFQYD